MLIYDALRKDHKTIKALLNELIQLGANDEDRRHDLVEQIRDELVPHSRAEESVFYNSIREVASAQDVAMHGFEEHMMAEGLLRTLQAADKIDAGWMATAKKLKQALDHHIEEEEGKMFNVAQHLFTEQEAKMMGEAFESLKPQVREEGFMRQTLDRVANMMPPRLAAKLRTYGLEPRT